VINSLFSKLPNVGLQSFKKGKSRHLTTKEFSRQNLQFKLELYSKTEEFSRQNLRRKLELYSKTEEFSRQNLGRKSELYTKTEEISRQNLRCKLGLCWTRNSIYDAINTFAIFSSSINNEATIQ
jgi:hypothetical protein